MDSMNREPTAISIQLTANKKGSRGREFKDSSDLLRGVSRKLMAKGVLAVNFHL